MKGKASKLRKYEDDNIDPLKLYYAKEYYDGLLESEIGFPKILLLQASSLCNFSCIMCYRTLHVPERKIFGIQEGNMSLKLIKKLVRECQGEKDFLGFHLAEYGEPLMNPEITEIISCIHKAGLTSQIVTNGFYLDDKMIKGLINAGLSKIKISFQGATPKRYKFWRNNNYYEKVVSNVKNLVKARDAKKSDLYIQVGTSSCDDTEEELEKFVNYWKDLVDHVYWNYTILLHLKDKELFNKINVLRQAPKKEDKCNDPFLRMTVLWNGKVTQCVNDEGHFIGDLNKQTIYEVWHSTKMNANRKIILENGNILPNCDTCAAQPKETLQYNYRY
jgi:MoaA/NifB/PqqE/SkfB family radical SAM enzyme|tara:strand:+ start:324 stop:1319 length:996 start_codon:yes stop_codon:yes gene_type:complete